MGNVNRLCFPTFLLDRQVPGQDHPGKSPSDNPHNSPLEITSLVPSHLANVGGDTATTPKPQKILMDPMGNSHPMVLQGHLQLVAWTVSGVRSKIEDFQRGLSSSSVLHGEATPKHLTLVAGECGLIGARKEGVNPINTSVEKIIEFLAVQFNQGKQYSTLNSYRSSISVTHMPVDGVQLGKHPLISRLMKGVSTCALPSRDIPADGMCLKSYGTWKKKETQPPYR